MINATTNFQYFSTDGHFERKHLILLMAQSKATEFISTPQVRIVIVRYGRHMTHATTDGAHTRRRIELIPTEQCGRHKFWIFFIINIGTQS